MVKDKQLELKQIHNCSAYLWKSKKGNYFIYWYDCRQLGFASFENEKFSQSKQEELFRLLCDEIHNKDGEAAKSDEWVWCTIKDSPTLFDDVHNALKILFEN